MMTRVFLALAALFAAVSVAAGAFASHALRETLGDRALAIFETGARYQMYHALALLGIALLRDRALVSPRLLTAAGIAFTLGIPLFSGSLYALSLTKIPTWGVITPLGGVAFLLGWGLLFGAAIAPQPGGSEK